jgi:hypothetical protein
MRRTTIISYQILKTRFLINSGGPGAGNLDVSTPVAIENVASVDRASESAGSTLMEYGFSIDFSKEISSWSDFSVNVTSLFSQQGLAPIAMPILQGFAEAGAMLMLISLPQQ